MATAVSLRHISKTFDSNSLSRNSPAIGDHLPGKIYALKDVSLSVRPGEVLGVLGPSGCGKTTLLRVIAGLDQPTSGEVYYDNEPLRDIPMVERGIGMVFQNYALYPHLPSVDNIGFFLRLRKREPEIPERVKEISELMRIDLGPLLGRKPPTLSGGERQRVAIARCLARDPRIFLFDEPFSNLDAKQRTTMRVELKRLLQRYNVTSVYVTHDQTEAIALSDRIALLNNGELIQLGTYHQLYATPRNIFVAGFLGNPAMNLFPGFVQDRMWIGKAFNWGPIRSDLNQGARIVLGVRPEGFTVDPEGELSAQVELVDTIFGDRIQLAYTRLGTHTAVVKLPLTPTVVTGDQLRLGILPENIHLFDQESGMRIG